MADHTPAVAAEPVPEPTTLVVSRQFTSWLGGLNAGILFSTFEIGTMVGLFAGADGKLKAPEVKLWRPMGIAVRDSTIWVGAHSQMLRFENFIDPGQKQGQHDALIVPVTNHYTGDLDAHDVCIRKDGSPIFVATRFNCLAEISPTHSFRPVWMPPFISRLALEDRCHLNGLTCDGDDPAYVTAVSATNFSGSWRDHRVDGGVVIHVPSNEIIATGLSMPHSPRLRDGVLWLSQAGTGEFGKLDVKTGKFEALCFLPGFIRGISFLDDRAIIAVSEPRENGEYAGLPLQERLEKEGIRAQAAICVVNLKTGDIEHQATMKGFTGEIYDVAVLQDVGNPKFINPEPEPLSHIFRPEPMPQA